MRSSHKHGNESSALVLGCDVVGSAIAHALHTAGWDVVLIDEIDPPCAARGMSFANAWYLGSAELAGMAACFCASVKSIPTVLHRQNLIASTSWSWQGVAAALLPEVVVDARSADGGAPSTLRGRAPETLLTVGCGPGYVAGDQVDVCIDTSYGPSAGSVPRFGATPPTLGDPAVLAGAGAERYVHAPRNGRMRTHCRIGDRVVAGEVVGDVNGHVITAPIAGALRGLTARGARVTRGHPVIELDPRDDPALCYGLDERGERIARGVVEMLSVRGMLRPRELAPGAVRPVQWLS